MGSNPGPLPPQATALACFGTLYVYRRLNVYKRLNRSRSKLTKSHPQNHPVPLGRYDSGKTLRDVIVSCVQLFKKYCY